MSYHEVYLLKKCPLCGSTHTKPVKFEKNIFTGDFDPEVKSYTDTWVTLLQCQNCSFAFAKEIPVDPNFFDKRYQFDFDPSFEVEATYKSSILDQTFKLIAQNGKWNGRLLDIGSFGGNLIKYAMDKGYEPEGIEVNASMAKASSEKLGVKVHNCKVQDYSGNGEQYDVITLIDVLEHLFEPRGVIESCEKLLKPGGLLVIKVPQYKPQHIKQNISNWLNINPRGIFHNFGHINLFNQKSLSIVMKDCGMTPLDCVVAHSELWMESGFKYKVKNAFRVAVHTTLELFRKLTGINMGLNITIVARKN